MGLYVSFGIGRMWDYLCLLRRLKDNIKTFILDDEMLSKLEELFKLGRTRAIVIVLPYHMFFDGEIYKV